MSNNTQKNSIQIDEIKGQYQATSRELIDVFEQLERRCDQLIARYSARINKVEEKTKPLLYRLNQLNDRSPSSKEQEEHIKNKIESIKQYYQNKANQVKLAEIKKFKATIRGQKIKLNNVKAYAYRNILIPENEMPDLTQADAVQKFHRAFHDKFSPTFNSCKLEVQSAAERLLRGRRLTIVDGKEEVVKEPQLKEHYYRFTPLVKILANIILPCTIVGSYVKMLFQGTNHAFFTTRTDAQCIGADAFHRIRDYKLPSLSDTSDTKQTCSLF